MSVFIRTECGATFEGDLITASEAAFQHSGECPAVTQNNLPVEHVCPRKSEENDARTTEVAQ